MEDKVGEMVDPGIEFKEVIFNGERQFTERLIVTEVVMGGENPEDTVPSQFSNPLVFGQMGIVVPVGESVPSDRLHRHRDDQQE